MNPIYSTHSHDELLNVNLTLPIEGMRGNWKENLIAEGKRLRDKVNNPAYPARLSNNAHLNETKYAIFMQVLYQLRNSFLSRSFERSVPIARLECQINEVILSIEGREIKDTDENAETSDVLKLAQPTIKEIDPNVVLRQAQQDAQRIYSEHLAKYFEIAEQEQREII